MMNFLYLEGAYLILGAIVLAVTLYVTTRPFMGKGAVKKGLIMVSVVIALLIGAHYTITMQRIDEVKRAYTEDRPIECESRMQRKVAQSVRVQRSKGWRLEGDHFVSPYYSRPFFIARCIAK